MKLSVAGKQVEVGSALRHHIDAILPQAIEKYFGNPIETGVVLSRDGAGVRADISVHVGRGILVQSHHVASQAVPAFDGAAERLAKRLRRYKRRLRDHHRRPDAANAELPARHYVLAADADAPSGRPAEGAADLPAIVAEMATTIEQLSVSEAVMRLELAEMPALLFQNSAHGGLNMIYRRADGHIGWVDPRTIDKQ
ncbi:MAG: ribosome-associated translation inhibitor RaiA [Proteobacteria bacterium]|nr:ribosome-associated translation inhibitor RaiA [Pseudomonadota bacterium]MBI3498503.1 ribosome-associated translation inhibitor RaiA [Pseudomonadota bacterium]